MASAGPKSVLEQMGAFSVYVCSLGDVRALFFEKTGLFLRNRGKVGFETDGGFFYVRLYLGDVRALGIHRCVI